MIELHQFRKDSAGHNYSPFCLKVEAYLKLAGLPFKEVTSDVRKAPKGKFPFIVDDEKTIADSGHIFDYLKKNYKDFDSHLSDEQKATSLAWSRMLEEHHYFTAIYIRWVMDDNWIKLKNIFFSFLPWPINKFVPNLVRKKMKRDLLGHGILKHSHEEIIAMSKANISAMSDALGDKKFFFGEQMSSFDITLYAFNTNMADVPFESGAKEHILTKDNLLAHTKRMKQKIG